MSIISVPRGKWHDFADSVSSKIRIMGIITPYLAPRALYETSSQLFHDKFLGVNKVNMWKVFCKF